MGRRLLLELFQEYFMSHFSPFVCLPLLPARMRSRPEAFPLGGNLLVASADHSLEDVPGCYNLLRLSPDVNTLENDQPSGGSYTVAAFERRPTRSAGSLCRT